MERLETRKQKEKRIKANRRNKKIVLITAFAVVGLLAVIFATAGTRLTAQRSANEAKSEEIEKQIETEKQRGEELDTKKEYMKSREYIEKVAKEALGLVYPDEVIFKYKE